mgnify:FL=1|tara:strand:- start:294 stop:497 length:204 start_codon:yes stop_codon:yes gene_type:complete
MQVEVRNNNIEGALRILKKKLLQENTFNELKRKEYFESRGAKRRRERGAAKRRYKRETTKQKIELGY